VHRVLLTELDNPDKFAEFYAIFHADSLLGTGMFAQNTGWLLRETGERQEKVSVELYREYAERRVELIQELRAKGVTELDRAIEAAQRLLDRILFIAFAEDRGLLPDRNLLKHTSFVRVAGLTAWQAFQLLFRSIDKGDSLNGIPKYNGNLFECEQTGRSHLSRQDEQSTGARFAWTVPLSKKIRNIPFGRPSVQLPKSHPCSSCRCPGSSSSTPEFMGNVV
jgi:hypothetical protein